MGRKTIAIAAVTMALLLSVGVPVLNAIGSGGLDINEPVNITEQTKKDSGGLGRVLTAPFRALSKLFGGGKKRKPVSSITDKDIKKFESAQVERINDAQTPTAPTETAGESTATDHVNKGREFLNAGRLNEAIAELTLAVSLDPKSGEANTLLGVAYDRKGLGDRAREAFKTALHSPDDQAMHLNNLGYLQYRHGEFVEAIKYLKQAARLDPSDSRIWSNLSLAQLAAGKFDDAYKSSAHVVGEFDSRRKIAARLEWAGKPKDAIKQLEKARAIHPNSIEVLSELKRLYENTGQDEKAQLARQSLNLAQAGANAPAQK